MIKRIISIVMLVLVINYYTYTVSVSAADVSTGTVSDKSNEQSSNNETNNRILSDRYGNYKMCFIDEDDKMISDKITITDGYYDQVPTVPDKEGYTFWGWKLTAVDKGTWYYSAVYKSNNQSNYEFLYGDNTKIDINRDSNCVGNYKLVFNDDKGNEISSIEIPSGYESKMPIPKEKQGCYFWGFSIVNVDRGGWLYRVVYKNYNEPQYNNEGNADIEPKKENDVSSDISNESDESINNSSANSDTSDNKMVIVLFLSLIMSSYIVINIKKNTNSNKICS
ncbi:MAG: hypothetical protein PUD42_08335 [Clostridiales bacterium]|nr:hypothetical protein [Clostridiales bacterium]